MKRLDLLGFLLAPSLCPLFSPSSRLELEVCAGAAALAAQPRSAADTMGRGRQSALRTGGAGCSAWPSHRCNPIAAAGVAAPPPAAALRRPPEPGVRAPRDVKGPRGGRAHLTTEVPGHFSRSHSAGRQVGWADGMLRHSEEPASGQSAPENP